MDYEEVYTVSVHTIGVIDQSVSEIIDDFLLNSEGMYETAN